VDKAQNDDAARAEQFLAASEARSGEYRVVIRHAQALVLARSGDSTGALRLVSAQEERSRLPASVRGWCSLVVSDIPALAGQEEAALAHLSDAIALLTTRRSHGVRIATQLRLIDAAIKQGNYDLALDNLTEVRWQAVRHRHADLVATTEGYLVQMMLSVGNKSGALWILHQISPRDPRRVRVSETGARSATWNVLHSQVALQQGGPRRSAEAGRDRGPACGAVG
jgi:hypothetical protein